MDDNAIEMLKHAIWVSGLTASDYARQILVRDPRTVRRWLAGDAPIPKSVRDYLEGLVEPSLPTG